MPICTDRVKGMPVRFFEKIKYYEMFFPLDFFRIFMVKENNKLHAFSLMVRGLPLNFFLSLYIFPFTNTEMKTVPMGFCLLSDPPGAANPVMATETSDLITRERFFASESVTCCDSAEYFSIIPGGIFNNLVFTFES